MNCTELYQDIESLVKQREKLTEKLALMHETMTGRIDLKKLISDIDEFENKVLEKYLDNFAEKNWEWVGKLVNILVDLWIETDTVRMYIP